METRKELIEGLKERIDKLSEEKLKDVSRFLESLDNENQKLKLLSFSGSWSDLDEETFNDLTEGIEKRRKNNRTRLFE